MKWRVAAVAWFAAWAVMLPLVHSHLAAASDIFGAAPRGIIHTIFAPDLADTIDLTAKPHFHTAQFSSPEIAFSVLSDKGVFPKLTAAGIGAAITPALLQRHWDRAADCRHAGRADLSTASPRAPPVALA